ncbi:MAG: hypothetical protein M0Z94_21005 [Dehalococcoidales bacterium]|nr:hypothetical protein [Dehalococcoidales bacterium]
MANPEHVALVREGARALAEWRREYPEVVLDLRWANLGEANFGGATLKGCSIYGITAWELDLETADQSELVISPPDEPTVTVDSACAGARGLPAGERGIGLRQNGGGDCHDKDAESTGGGVKYRRTPPSARRIVSAVNDFNLDRYGLALDAVEDSLR